MIFEAIRREGEHELSSTARALCWSGVAAGLAISLSVVAKGVLASTRPHEHRTSGLKNLGYTVGFLIVILGRMQLFKENTITPTLPLFMSPSVGKVAQIARLWAIVFAANMLGCLMAALVLFHGNILPETRFEGILTIWRHTLKPYNWNTPPGAFRRGS